MPPLHVTAAAARPRPAPRRGARPLWLAVLVAAAALTGGCAERGLLTRPRAASGTGTWLAVWVAGASAAAVAGVLLTLPAWRTRGGARFAVTLLSLQAGGAAVAGAVLTGTAVRSWQLLDRPRTTPSVALVRLSGVDGDTAFFALMVASALVASALVVTLTAAGARLAAGVDRRERWIATAVLAGESIGAAYAAVRLLLGDRGLPFTAPTAALPLLALAAATCWPRAGRT